MTKVEFLDQYERALDQFGEVNKMVVAVKLPTEATELIINSEQITSKVAYYTSAYNDKMELTHNTNIRIVSCLFA